MLRRFSTLVSGGKFTPSFRTYLVDDVKKQPCSFFHDVPLDLNPIDKTASMVVEIPRYTQAKFEISKEIPFNPIVQDTKKGQLRYVNNIFPFKGYPFNYGAFPQTWEDPTKEDLTSLFGDNDPLDVIEVGGQAGVLGQVKTVKILGALALIDDGEMDWKIVTVDTRDPLANKLSGIETVDKVLPGALDLLRFWFKNYKRPTGKPENKFAFEGRYLDAEEAVEVVQKCQERWAKLVAGEIDADGKSLPQIVNGSVETSPGFKDSVAIEVEKGEQGAVPAEIETVYYYKS